MIKGLFSPHGCIFGILVFGLVGNILALLNFTIWHYRLGIWTQHKKINLMQLKTGFTLHAVTKNLNEQLAKLEGL
jgi:hypothetical protein